MSTENTPGAEGDIIKEIETEEAGLIRLLGSHALAKACMDPFDYALRLRTGEVIRFESAMVLNKEWVRLTTKPYEDEDTYHPLAFPAPRGVEVRIADIVWVMDAPMGS